MIKKILILLFFINIIKPILSSDNKKNIEILQNEDNKLKFNILNQKKIYDINDPCKKGPCFTAPKYDRINCNQVTHASVIGDECFDNKSEFGGACHITYNKCDEYIGNKIIYTSKTFVKCWCP